MPGFEHILIVGGGTAAALAHDLVLRGFRVTLVEKGELLSGTTGRHHGLLHSGARYVLHDVETARECYRENQILRKLAPQAIEPSGGLFVALDDEDLFFREPFLDLCRTAGIPAVPLAASEALALEPGLNPGLRGAVSVPDAVMDAFRLPLHFFATARKNGARLLNFTEVTALDLAGGCVRAVEVFDHRRHGTFKIAADLVVNAAGPWSGRIAAMAGIRVPIQPSPGVMVSLAGRLSRRVINRLHPAGEGDILVPQRRLSILGTTAGLADDPDAALVPPEQVARLRRLGAELLPAAAGLPVHAAWSACRPLLRSAATEDPLRISRGFDCFDHAARDGVEGLVTIIGGKATTLRAMAERTADLICRKTGREAGCRTGRSPLLPYRMFWTERGAR
jgi:glycerol-3-phosphate dehydrogenase